MKFDFAERGNIWAQVLFSWHLVCQKEMVYNKNSSYGNHQERGSSEHIKHSEVGFKCHPLQNKMITIALFKITIVLFTSRGNSELHGVLFQQPFIINILIFFVCLSLRQMAFQFVLVMLTALQVLKVNRVLNLLFFLFSILYLSFVDPSGKMFTFPHVTNTAHARLITLAQDFIHNAWWLKMSFRS